MWHVRRAGARPRAATLTAVSLLVVLALIGGCGGSTTIATRSSGSTMPAALASAIARTLAASSIEATMTLPIDPTTTDWQSAGSLQFVYQAPDRVELKDLTHPDAPDHDIWIGTAHYIDLSSSPASSLPNPPGQAPPVSFVGGLNPTGWTEHIDTMMTAGAMKDMFFRPLRLRVPRAQVVTGSGPTYSFRLHYTIGGDTAQATFDAWGTIRLARGWVASIDMSTIDATVGRPSWLPPVPPMIEHFTYSHYNSAPPVNPPPASEVTVEPDGR